MTWFSLVIIFHTKVRETYLKILQTNQCYKSVLEIHEDSFSQNEKYLSITTDHINHLNLSSKDGRLVSGNLASIGFCFAFWFYVNTIWKTIPKHIKRVRNMLTLYRVGTTQNEQEHKEWYKYCTKQTQRKEIMNIIMMIS